MKKKLTHIFLLLAGWAMVFSCVKEELEVTKSEFNLQLTPEVTSRFNPLTKAELVHADSDIPGDSLILYGWNGSTKWINKAKATYSSSTHKWALSGGYKLKAGGSYSFLSYANLPVAGASVSAPETATGDMVLTVSDIADAQEDVLLGRGATSVATEEDADVTINYFHPFASVQFALGNAPEIETVKSVSLTGVYSSGKTTFNNSLTPTDGIIEFSWTDLGSANATLEESGLEKEEGDTLATFVVIPQDLASKKVILTVAYDKTGGGEGNIIKELDNGVWRAGYTTTYSLFKNAGDVAVEISDDIKPTNNGTSKIYVRATITGAWYDEYGNIVAPWSTADGTFTNLPGTGWEKSEDIYYYKEGLGNGESATALYSSYTAPVTPPVAGATLKMDILVQAIPYNASKTCQEAFETLSKN